MPKLINLGNEMIKISADGKSIEYSTNKGSSFSSRCSMSSSNGEPQSLSDGGNEILLITSKKLMYSTNKGSSFSLRKNL